MILERQHIKAIKLLAMEILYAKPHGSLISQKELYYIIYANLEFAHYTAKHLVERHIYSMIRMAIRNNTYRKYTRRGYYERI